MNATNNNRDRILIIDDNRAIHDDYRKILGEDRPASASLAAKEAALFNQPLREKPRLSCDIQSAYQGQEGVALVQQAVQEGRPYAMAFVDVRMPPGWDGIETACKMWEVAPDLQVVICTAYADYSWGDMIERLGCSDRWVILKKPFDPVEVMQLVGAFTEKVRLLHQVRAKREDLERRVQERTADLAVANEALRVTQFAMDKASDAIFWFRPDASCAYVNDAACRLTECSRPELLTRTARDLNAAFFRGDWPAYWAELKQRQSITIESTYCAQAGRSIPVEITANSIEFSGKEYMCLFVRDISERKRIEAQVRSQQKMEAISMLAGGVAHDFNNILTSVRGYTELLLDRLKNDKAAQADLNIMLHEVDRVVALTSQLLSFSQRQLLSLRVAGLNSLIDKMKAPLQALLGDRIDLQLDLKADLDQVKVDQVQLMNILSELVDNAHEAMPEGGRVTIRTENITVGKTEAASSPDGRTGEFVRLSLSDNGVGITPDTVQHLFDPFFSTKQIGAGLGLPSVYGLVRQHHGWITVVSAPGNGTTFHIYLPNDIPARDNQAPAAFQAVQQGHAELILLVEDEENLRNLTRRALQAKGYQVIATGSCAEALTAFEQQRGRVDLLLSDIVLPDRNGIDLAVELQSRHPGLKILMTSGFTDEARWPALKQHNYRFIPKPFSMTELFQTVHAVLVTAPGQAGSSIK